MTKTIGIRIYRIGVNERGNGSSLPLNFSEFTMSVQDFISHFVKEHQNATRDNDLERSWFFEEKEADGAGKSRGYIHYGTFGFESNFVDHKTKKRNYRRKSTDTEEIPLYYEFWCPQKSNFALIALQSFQGRSCISMVNQKLKSGFEEINPQFVMNIRKLQPSDGTENGYAQSPVKSLTLINRRSHSDLADKYFDKGNTSEVDITITISAQRKKSLGTLGGLLTSMKNDGKSVIMHEGGEFSEATAQIRVGSRTRRVGILGISGDAGVIDLTDAIITGPDGHPTFDSIKEEATEILTDFYKTLSGPKP